MAKYYEVEVDCTIKATGKILIEADSPEKAKEIAENSDFDVDFINKDVVIDNSLEADIINSKSVDVNETDKDSIKKYWLIDLTEAKNDDRRFCRPCKENERRAEGIL